MRAAWIQIQILQGFCPEKVFEMEAARPREDVRECIIASQAADWPTKKCPSMTTKVERRHKRWAVFLFNESGAIEQVGLVK